jgi:UDPglucose--hexose-1-phosphate uridylyltransferase
LSAPEIRIDQLTGLRTIVAPGRADRPQKTRSAVPSPDISGERNSGAEGAAGDCPFCEGNEAKTPPEVYAARPGGAAADTPGWTSRVVPNLYPALGEGDDEPRADSNPELFASRPAVGAHEVLINAPEHVTAMAELNEERFLGAVEAWRERMRAHADAAYVQLVVNEGAGAGASLPHTHAQLYALPFVPAAIARERERVGAYAERSTGGGLLSDVLVEEVRRRERLVAIDEEAALICPWASRSPYELRVVPRQPAARFEEDTTGATMIRTAMRLLAEHFDGQPELNLWVVTAPRGTDEFHWHVDIAPRLTNKASFEFATGVDINVYPPERAAADLKECL